MSIFAAIAVLEFGSPMMLPWLAAAALPWLINLWIRRRHAETPWAAVQLLMVAVEARARRIRLREWLLLAMRAAILALVALAASRPAWRTGAAGGQERTHHVLVVDCSMSMDCREGEQSRFEWARERALEIIDGTIAGDALTVIEWSSTAENLLGRAAFDRGAAEAAVGAVRQSSARADLDDALSAVHAAIDGLRSDAPGVARTRVWFLSDATATTWAAAVAASEASADTVAGTAARWRRLAERAVISIETASDGAPDNLAVTAMRLANPLATLGEPLRVTAQVEAFGQRTWNDAAVELRLNGAVVDQQRASIAPGAPATVEFQVRVDAPGSAALEARLVETDALRADNRRWLAARTRRRVRVVCFAGAPHAAEDVARALNPRRQEAEGADGISVDVEPDSRIGRTDLASYDAVFLCNIGAAAERNSNQLRRYVVDGGALAAVLGDRTDAAAYNELLAALSEQAPRDGGPASAVQIAGGPLTGEWRLDAREYRHPVLAPFAGQNRAGLLGVRVEKYFPLTVSPPTATEAALNFSSGDPAIVLGDYGMGRFGVAATDVALNVEGRPWSSFAVSPSFLPLVRELLSFLVGGADDGASATVGEQLARPGAASTRGSAAGVWFTPTGQRVQTAPAATRPGIYSFRPKKSGDAQLIAVNVDPRESDLATIDASRLPSVERGAEGAAGASAIGRVVPLAATLLAAAAALALIETATAWTLGRGRA